MLISYPWERFFFAPDGEPTGGENDPENPPSDPEAEPEENPKTVDFEKFKAEKNRADWASGALRTAQSKITDLQSQIDELKASTKKGNNQFDAEAATKTINDLKAALANEQGARKAERIEREVRAALGDKIADGAWDYFWNTKKGEFDIVEFEGKEMVRKAATPYAELSEFVAEIPAVFLKPGHAKGAGDPPTQKDQGKTPTSFPSGWSNYSHEQKRDWFIANPDFKL